MDVLKRPDLDRVKLSGRTLQKAVGGPDEGRVTSSKMTVGFARYSAESGPMEPHQHAEETIYVVDARDGYIRPGTAANQMGDRLQLAAGMILHFPELEWHVFEWDEGGYVDVLFIYGQVDNIRPDQIKLSEAGVTEPADAASCALSWTTSHSASTPPPQRFSKQSPRQP